MRVQMYHSMSSPPGIAQWSHSFYLGSYSCLASFPGHSRFYLRKISNDFSPQLGDKIWEWPVPMLQPTQLLYNRCAQSDCSSWLSSISIIFQAHLRASYLRLSCMTILLTITLNYSIQKHTDWRMLLQFNSLVLDSLMLVPFNFILFYKVVVQFTYVP